MTREEALKIVRENYPHFGTTEPWLDLEKALATLIPELAESEDERIRKWLIEECQKVIDIANPAYDTSKAKKAIAWLEKQKENPKSADSISSDCTSDVKCEDSDTVKWLKSLRPSWKPSEEQMEALLNTLHPDDPYYHDLKSLYEQLKKL